MTRALANPLAAAVAAAAKLPATTGATARAQARSERPQMVLVDVSTSMADRAGAQRKIDILGQALAWVLAGTPAMERVAFSTIPRVLSPAEPLPEPSGGTAMHLALRHATAAKAGHVMVISDGAPDDKAAALDAARALVKAMATISTLYVGPDSDQQAIGFMQELATLGGGRAHRHDIVGQASLSGPPSARLAESLRLALPGPGR